MGFHYPFSFHTNNWLLALSAYTRPKHQTALFSRLNVPSVCFNIIHTRRNRSFVPGAKPHLHNHTHSPKPDLELIFSCKRLFLECSKCSHSVLEYSFRIL